MSIGRIVYLQFVLLLFLSVATLYAQSGEDYNCVLELPPPGGSQQEPLADQRGGRFIPSQDTFHVLVVFVQFPDDRFDTLNPNWPTYPLTGIYPPPAYLNTFIDSVVSQNSQSGNMSHYFRAMSIDRFKLTGKALHVYTPQTRQWYKDNNKRYWDINRDVMLRVDSMISLAPFDNWIRGTNYNHTKGQDTIVDMIFMLYRNVWADDETTYRYVFQFAGAQADLGRIGDIWVDNNTRRIQTYSLQSGTTSIVVHGAETLNLPPYRAQIHELAHFFFFGSNSDHNGGGFWAMLNAWTFRHNSQRQSCANSYERELVGWIAPESLYATTYNVTMTDCQGPRVFPHQGQNDSPR